MKRECAVKFFRMRPAVSVDISSYERMNFGCGYDKRDGYLNVDMDPACMPDVLVEPGDFSPFPKRHFVEVQAKDVLEHIPRTQTMGALLEFASLLRPEGLLVVQTTNILELANRMAENPAFADQYGWTQCLFGTQAHPGDFHFTGFTETTLRVHLAAAGFDVVARDLVDGWMIRWECHKSANWESALNPSLPDEAFIASAYSHFFGRAVDQTGLTHYRNELARRRSRREILKDLNCAPERLYVTAQQLGL